MSDPLAINEIFESIQGEAHFTGTPSIFIRLQGCAVACPWCDTKHTWPMSTADEVPLAEILTRPADDARHARVTVDELLAALAPYSARHVVITGGEPCDFDLTPLTSALLAAGRSVQIETSGTAPVRAAPGTWVTVSPKPDMPGGLAVRRDALERADEWKLPIGKPEDMARFDALLTGIHPPGEIWLQPLSRNPKATALCIAEATKRNWKVSIQTHLFLGIR